MKVVLIQPFIGDYRQNVLNLLVENWGEDFQVFTGTNFFDPTVKTDVVLRKNLFRARNHFFLGRRLLFQTGLWKAALKADVLIMDMNPRNISNWLILFLRRWKKRKTVLWGHAWPRNGRDSRSDKLRGVLRGLGDVILCYTETQAQELRAIMPHTKILAAPNALYLRRDIGAVQAETVDKFIYVGRLVAEKKPDLLLRAWAKAMLEIPAPAQLLFVGDGPMRKILEAQARELKIEDRTRFVGHISDLERLREFYAASVASFSPGYVGLSITQSFAFGVPMGIARDEPHAPEIEAAIEGENCLFFPSDSPEKLADVMLRFFRDREQWLQKRAVITQDCAQRYSAELMAERIVEATR